MEDLEAVEEEDQEVVKTMKNHILAVKDMKRREERIHLLTSNLVMVLRTKSMEAEMQDLLDQRLEINFRMEKDQEITRLQDSMEKKESSRKEDHIVVEVAVEVVVVVEEVAKVVEEVMMVVVEVEAVKEVAEVVKEVAEVVEEVEVEEVEEAPAPNLDDKTRRALHDAAVRLAESSNYVTVGTCEFLVQDDEFFFLEVNPRIQVEHPVTEQVTGVDLVKLQIRLAAGERMPLKQSDIQLTGHSIEVRINAEDPETYFPSLGRIERLGFPGGPGVRLDAALYRGLEVTPFYDSMLGKLIVYGADRQQAIARCIRALQELRVVGVLTSLPVALRTLHSEEFVSGDYDTGILERIDCKSHTHQEVAMLSAAAARFLAAQKVGVPAAAEDGAAEAAPAWSLLGRQQRLWRTR